jgi:hypothetical protein
MDRFRARALRSAVRTLLRGLVIQAQPNQAQRALLADHLRLADSIFFLADDRWNNCARAARERLFGNCVRFDLTSGSIFGLRCLLPNEMQSH